MDFKSKENINFKKRKKYEDNLTKGETIESSLKCEPQNLFKYCRLNLNIMPANKSNKLLEKLKYYQSENGISEKVRKVSSTPEKEKNNILRQRAMAVFTSGEGSSGKFKQ